MKALTMRFTTFSFISKLRLLILSALLSTGLAIAAQEPTMNQIYAAAESGNLDQAQVMVQQVLIGHPNSAKAHYVQSELFARQGNVAKAQESLSTAERLAPGLPFARQEAVQALRSQLAAGKTSASPAHSVAGPSTAPAAPASGSWMFPAVLAGGVIAAAYFVFRRRSPQAYEPVASYGNGLNGPQTFGNGSMQPAYGTPGYGQPSYGQPAGTGLGGKIMGGVATGLAVGAGVVAAEAIGRSLMGNHESSQSHANDSYNNQFTPLGGNDDMGGQNFGISDTSWDDGSSTDSGGDWDN